MILLIYFMGSQRSLFGSKVEVEARFRTVVGLQSGGNVRFSGLNIGTVKSVAIANDSLVSVILLIDNEAAKFIKKDAFASIDSDGLMGNKIISISGGTSDEYISDGDLLQSKEPMSIDDIISSFKNASDNANRLTNNLLLISDQINKGEGLLGKLVSDTALAFRIEHMTASLEASSHNAARITAEIKRAAQQINEGDGFVSKMLYDSSIAVSADQAIDSISAVTENLAIASENLKIFMQKLNDDKGAVDKLMNDPAVAKDVEATIYNLNKGTANIDEVLETINDSWILNLFSGGQGDKAKQRKE